MIKTDEYYKEVYGRTNNLKKGFLAFFYGISCYPRLLIEVFLRHDMGIRYFRLNQCIRLALTMLFLPFWLPTNQGYPWLHTVLVNWGWYLFLIAFIKFSWDRHKECRKPLGYFDFNHFSLSAGRRLRKVDTFKFMGKEVNPPIKDIYLEPFLVTVLGLTSLLLGQWMLALLLIICAGIYSLSYKAAYELGRDILLDKIDEDLINRDFTDTFLNDKPTTSNFQYFGFKPSTDEVRKGLVNLFRDDDEGIGVK